MVTINEIMTTEVVTLGMNDNLMDVHELMFKRNVRHIPIVDEKTRLVGIVSHRDLLSATPVTSGNRGRVYAHTRTSEIMRSGVETITPSTNVRHAALTLERLKIGCLPVVSGSYLVGIVTSSDLIAVAINLMEQLELQEEPG